MDNNQQNTVPVRNSSTRPNGPRHSTVQSRTQPPKKKSLRPWQIVLGAALLLGLSAIVAYTALGIGSPVDRSKYQAVFLTNGQIYFGKLSGWGGPQPTLTDVYYFQATGEGAGGESEQPGGANGTQTLVKLGEEVHKPSDKLILNRDSILFVENIEDDGQVVEAIKQNQENN